MSPCRQGRPAGRPVSSASPGTTIRIAAGTHTERPDEPYALTWPTPNSCVVAAGGPATIQAAAGQRYGVSITGDDTVIESLTLRGFAYNIGLDAGNGATQRRVTIERVTIDQPAGELPEGIVAYGDNRALAGQPPTVDGLLVLSGPRPRCSRRRPRARTARSVADTGDGTRRRPGRIGMTA